MPDNPVVLSPIEQELFNALMEEHSAMVVLTKTKRRWFKSVQVPWIITRSEISHINAWRIAENKRREVIRHFYGDGYAV